MNQKTPVDGKHVIATESIRTVKSPCIGVCQINSARVCVGCFRTLDEIAAWSSVPVRDQMIIVLRARERATANGFK